MLVVRTKLVDDFTTSFCYAFFYIAIHFESNPRWLIACGINQHHVTHVDRCRQFNHLAFFRTGSRAHVALAQIDPLNDHRDLSARFTPKHLDHLARLAFISPRQYFYIVAGFYFHTNYNTSGDKEIIFWNPLVRSSRATGPKIRVPFGSLLFLSIMTPAFSSNRI